MVHYFWVLRTFLEERTRVYPLVGILLPGRSSISDVVLDVGIYIKKLCWVFFPTRVSQDKYSVSYLCLVYLSVDLFNVNCKRTLTCGKTNMVSELS